MYYFLHRVLSLCTCYTGRKLRKKTHTHSMRHTEHLLIAEIFIYKYADLLLFIVAQRETYPHTSRNRYRLESMWKTWTNVFINAARLHYVYIVCYTVYIQIHSIRLECIYTYSSFCLPSSFNPPIRLFSIASGKDFAVHVFYMSLCNIRVLGKIQNECVIFWNISKKSIAVYARYVHFWSRE